MKKHRTNGRMMRIEELTLLINRSNMGNRMATEELVEKIYGYVRRRTMFICGSPDLSPDITQNVLIKILSGLPGLKKADAFIAWMDKIIRNECYSHLKQNPNSSRYFLPIKTDDPAYSVDPEQFNRLANQEAMKILSTKMKKLSPKEQTVLYLREYEGYDNNEIGKILGIKPVTARVLYMRAGAKLFKMMSPANDGGK
jgi:RNA polymerase sigma factor (sigma-70 family)